MNEILINKGTELSELNISCNGPPIGSKLSSGACPSGKNEKWDIQFAAGRSKYISENSSPEMKPQLENVHDILEVPLQITEESDYLEYAKQIIDILHKPLIKDRPKMKWNFDTDIKCMNLILYISEPEHYDSSHGDIKIPKTAIPILGNTFHDLIYRNKAWIFTSGESNFIRDIIGEGVLQVTKKQKSLVKGLKNRLELTDLISKYTKDPNESVAGRDSFLDTLSDSISPFSNLHIILKHCCKDKDMIEKLLYSIGHIS